LKLLRHILFFILFVIVLAVPPFMLANNGYASLLIPHFWLVFFFLSGLTLVVVIAVLIGQQMDAEKGTQMFLATTVFKILACLVFALIFILKNKLNRYIFVAEFFYIYFLNTAFEIYILLRNLRNQNSR